MDMMEIRRRVLIAALGGEQMLGELSKYQKITGLTVSVSNSMTFTHTLGMIPKIIFVTADTEGSESTLIKNIMLGQTGGHGVTGSNAVQAYAVHIDYEGTIGNGNAKMDSTEVQIRQQSAARYFDVNDTYTIELYA